MLEEYLHIFFTFLKGNLIIFFIIFKFKNKIGDS